MPQMAPMWWTMMFSMFNMSMIIMCIMIYFQKNTMPMKINLKSKIKKMNWKW
uniref:ATP synthase F0 subunit 8 n=1 Tax=Ischnobaenella hainana TaxID=1347743 RepID=A0A7I6HJM2_9HEMI|nr:ATP synthase F0 subunit 8 [Ischnobaenella hainana]QZI86064.1 ATPase subunit 8 [Ischnobaenella hainana]